MVFVVYSVVVFLFPCDGLIAFFDLFFIVIY